jgi:hypothetical protein
MIGKKKGQPKQLVEMPVEAFATTLQMLVQDLKKESLLKFHGALKTLGLSFADGVDFTKWESWMWGKPTRNGCPIPAAYLVEYNNTRRLIEAFTDDPRLETFTDWCDEITKRQKDLLDVDKSAELEVAFAANAAPQIIKACHAKILGAFPMDKKGHSFQLTIASLNAFAELPMFTKSPEQCLKDLSTAVDTLTKMSAGESQATAGKTDFFRDLVMRAQHHYMQLSGGGASAGLTGKPAMLADMKKFEGDMKNASDVPFKIISNLRPYMNLLDNSEQKLVTGPPSF